MSSLLSSFIQNGLPVVTTVVGGAIASKKGKSAAKIALYSVTGYAAGWLTQKVIFFVADSVIPSLPSENATDLKALSDGTSDTTPLKDEVEAEKSNVTQLNIARENT